MLGPGLVSAGPWYENITFPGPDGLTLKGRLYHPDAGLVSGSRPPAVVIMHGCSGIWSYSNPQNGVAQSHIEKWGRKFAASGTVALAVDSFTTRTPEGVSALDFQLQCSGKPYAGAVDPYTERLRDIEAAHESHSPARVASARWFLPRALRLGGERPGRFFRQPI